jgi:hypothetical protein
MKPQTSGKRQVPFWMPVSVLAVILIGLTIVYVLNSMQLQLILAFPLGLMMFFFDAKVSNEYLAPLLIFPYCLYFLLFMAIFVARKWTTFSTVCLILIGVLLLNLAGCRHGLSYVQPQAHAE